MIVWWLAKQHSLLEAVFILLQYCVQVYSCIVCSLHGKLPSTACCQMQCWKQLQNPCVCVRPVCLASCPKKAHNWSICCDKTLALPMLWQKYVCTVTSVVCSSGLIPTPTATFAYRGAGNETTSPLTWLVNCLKLAQQDESTKDNVFLLVSSLHSVTLVTVKPNLVVV